MLATNFEIFAGLCPAISSALLEKMPGRTDEAGEVLTREIVCIGGVPA